MGNPKRPIIQQKAIKSLGGNVHLREPGKASEQERILKKGQRNFREIGH